MRSLPSERDRRPRQKRRERRARSLTEIGGFREVLGTHVRAFLRSRVRAPFLRPDLSLADGKRQAVSPEAGFCGAVSNERGGGRGLLAVYRHLRGVDARGVSAAGHPPRDISRSRQTDLEIFLFFRGRADKVSHYPRSARKPLGGRGESFWIARAIALWVVL